MINKSYKAHKVFMYATFVLGIGTVSFPIKNADKSNILSFLLCAIALLLVLFCLKALLKGAFKEGKAKAAVAFFYVLLTVLSLYVAVEAARVYTDFVSSRMLSFTAKWLIALIFLFVCAVLSMCEMKTVLKFSLITFIFSFVAVGVMFALSFKDFKLENISLLGVPDVKSLILQVTEYFKALILPIVLLPFIEQTVSEKKGEKGLYWGVSLGLILLCICIANSLLIFGANTASKMQYPYCDALSTVTLSKLYTRMDGFSYVLYFFTCLIRCSLCVEVIKYLAKNLGFKYLKGLTVVLCAAIFLICIF